VYLHLELHGNIPIERLKKFTLLSIFTGKMDDLKERRE